MYVSPFHRMSPSEYPTFGFVRKEKSSVTGTITEPKTETLSAPSTTPPSATILTFTVRGKNFALSVVSPLTM